MQAARSDPTCWKARPYLVPGAPGDRRRSLADSPPGRPRGRSQSRLAPAARGLCSLTIHRAPPVLDGSAHVAISSTRGQNPRDMVTRSTAPASHDPESRSVMAPFQPEIARRCARQHSRSPSAGQQGLVAELPAPSGCASGNRSHRDACLLNPGCGRRRLTRPARPEPVGRVLSPRRARPRELGRQTFRNTSPYPGDSTPIPIGK